VNYRFTNRTGGLSTGAFLSNNVATHVGDEVATVLANRARLESICCKRAMYVFSMKEDVPLKLALSTLIEEMV
jgi:copper oxidase (laccase) domain-containing protein